MAEGESLDDDRSRRATRETLERAFEAGTVVRLIHDRARLGQFDALERFLVAHRIQFNRHSDSRYEFNAENVYCRGGKRPIVLFATEEGCPLLPCAELTAILDNASLVFRQF